MSIFERVAQTIKKIMSEDCKVTLDSHLEDNLSMDSLDRVELMIALEEEFRATIPDEEAQKLSTVRQIVEFIENA